MNIFYLPPFPDMPPAQATVSSPSSPDEDPPPDDENLDSAIAAFVGDRANTTADLGFPDLDVGGTFLNNDWEDAAFMAGVNEATSDDAMDVDSSDDEIALQDQAEEKAEEKAEEIVQELENKVAEEDPLAPFDSYFESDSDDDNPTRRRRNRSFEPWERRLRRRRR